MPAFIFYHEFKKHLADGTIDLDSNTFKALLSNTAPVPGTEDFRNDVTDIAAGNGYTAAGLTLAGVTWTETGAGLGVWRFNANDFAWTAAGGSIGPFRYVIVYKSTGTDTTDALVGYWDYGSALTLTDTNIFTVDIGASGIFELA